MDHDHPYDTKELHRLRSSHRRMRRVLAKPLECTSDMAPRLGVDDRSIEVEFYARRAAETILERHDKYVAHLELCRSGELLDEAVRLVSDGNTWASSAKTRLLNGSFTQSWLPFDEPDDAPDDSERDRQLREALLLIDIAEAHARTPDDTVDRDLVDKSDG